MNLKESFHYQNVLDGYINGALSLLRQPCNVTIEKQVHMKHKANADAEDETIESANVRTTDVSANHLIKFVELVLNEKEKVASAISAAKKTATIDVDKELSANKMKQRVAEQLNTLCLTQATERTFTARGYNFNSDKVQVPYTYDVKQTSTIDFDRNVAKAIAKRLLKESNDTSTSVDKIFIEQKVDFKPAFDVNDSFLDVLADFDNELNAKEAKKAAKDKTESEPKPAE